MHCLPINGSETKGDSHSYNYQRAIKSMQLTAGHDLSLTLGGEGELF